MSVVLDERTIKTLVVPAGNAPLIRALYKAQYQKSLLNLHQLHRKLCDDSPDLARRTNFAGAFEELSNTPADAQQIVLSYPSLGFWLDVAWELIRRQAHTQPDALPMETHLIDFGRFVLAAKLCAGCGEYGCLVTSGQRVVLPGTSSYLESRDTVPDRRVFVRVSGGVISAQGVNSVNHDVLKLTRYTVPTLKIGIEFNAVDVDLRLPGHSTFEYENLSPVDSVKWVSTLNDGWEWVAEQELALAEEMMLILRAIVPVKRAGEHIHASGSFKEAPGLIALSWDRDVPVLAEALVHEYHHQKLNALLNLDRLIVGPTFEPVYRSPWREDLRPLLGILHGVYTFQAVLRFWLNLLGTRDTGSYETSIRERTHTLHSQLRMALATLREHAVWSPLGEALFDAMIDEVNALAGRLP